MWKIQQPNLICGVLYGYIRDTLSEAYAMFWHRDKQLCYRLPYSTALGWTVSLLHAGFEFEAQQNDQKHRDNKPQSLLISDKKINNQ